jgi:hypothetical protein
MTKSKTFIAKGLPLMRMSQQWQSKSGQAIKLVSFLFF